MAVNPGVLKECKNRTLKINNLRINGKEFFFWNKMISSINCNQNKMISCIETIIKQSQ